MLPGVCSAAPQRAFPRQHASRWVGGTARLTRPSGGSGDAGPGARRACTGPPRAAQDRVEATGITLRIARAARVAKNFKPRARAEVVSPALSQGDFQEMVVFRLDLQGWLQ